MNGLNIKLFNQGTAIQAVEMIRPAVECLMEADVIKRKALAVNIPDPATGEVMYAGRIVLDEADWQDRFAMLAKGKAGLSLRTKMDTEKVIHKCPHLLETGDVKYPGGVFREGVVVGCSGVEAHYDHMIAAWIAEAIRGNCANILYTEIIPSDEDVVNWGG